MAEARTPAVPDGPRRALRAGRDEWPAIRATTASWQSLVDVRRAGSGPAEAWIAIADPASIERAVTARARWLGVDDLRIAASNFFKAYAQALLVPAAATFVHCGAVPDLSVANSRVAIPYPGRAVLSIGWAPGGGPTQEISGIEHVLDALVAEMLDDHLLLLVTCVRTSYRINERVLRTSIAYEIAAAFRRVVRDDGRRRQAVGEARRVLSAAGPRLADTGTLVVADGEGGLELRYERATCCLKHRIPGKTNCTGCSLVRE